MLLTTYSLKINNTLEYYTSGRFHSVRMEDMSRIASFATNMLINKLPADFYQKYPQKVDAVTAEDILRVAKKYINLRRIRLV